MSDVDDGAEDGGGSGTDRPGPFEQQRIEPVSGHRYGMVPEDLADVESVSDPRFSPDGTTLAFVVTSIDRAENTYRRRIWLADPSQAKAPRPLTGHGSASMPRWSPDGTTIAFVAEAEGGGSVICSLSMSGPGERQEIARSVEAVTELAFSPDGRELAFLARERDLAQYGTAAEAPKVKDQPPRHVRNLRYRFNGAGWTLDRPTRIFTVAADGSKPARHRTDGPASVEGLAWSPDGTRLAFSSGAHETADLDHACDLFILDLTSSSGPKAVTRTGPAYSGPSWSSDGSELAYLRRATPLVGPNNLEVGVIEIATGVERILSAGLDRTAVQNGGRGLIFVEDTVVFLAEDRGNLSCFAVARDGSSPPEVLLGGDRQVESFDITAGSIAAIVTAPTSLPELIVAALDVDPGSGVRVVGEERVLTELTARFTSSTRLVAPEHFLAYSADGTEIDCWAMLPPEVAGERVLATLLNVHGGPFTQYGNRFFDEFQLQVGAGFGVIYCNPRGSSGRSEAFGRAIRWPGAEVDPGSGWGGVDYEDVLACVDEACRRFPVIDAERLGILGGSYGGYMTSWAIGHTNRFKAAWSERSCNNLLAMEHNSDIAGFIASYVGTSHLADAESYLDRSPVRYVGSIATPVMIVHSEEDFRCPINQAEELFVALRRLAKPVEFVRFPGESHELSRSGSPTHRRQRAELLLQWFTASLAGGNEQKS